jgi:ubiquinol-cytochrome c reductase iron-sulfur subunit
VPRWLVSVAVLLLSRRRRRLEEPHERLVAEAPPNPRSELGVVLLLGAASVCSVAFVVVYALDRLGAAQTQYLGLALGLAFLFLAAALVVFARRLVPNEEVREPYPEEDAHAGQRAEIGQIVDESGDRLTRGRLLKVAAGGAGAAVGAALVVPALSLGPFLDTDPMLRTPWRRGVRLVDALGRRIHADDVEPKAFYTAFPFGADHEQMGAPVVLVRLPEDDLDLPAERRAWAPDGIVAYSKVCTHAGCAVSLYRVPLFQPTSSRPALICPCHYSTFDPATGGEVLFGPAGRPLPQLPLSVEGDGFLVAAGGFSGAVGPSWWGVRHR